MSDDIDAFLAGLDLDTDTDTDDTPDPLDVPSPEPVKKPRMKIMTGVYLGKRDNWEMFQQKWLIVLFIIMMKVLIF